MARLTFDEGFFTKRRRIATKEKHSDIPMQVDDEVLEGKKKLYLTTETVPVKRGKWIEKSTGGEHFHCCSKCGYVEWDTPSNYCSRCWARMDEE